MSTPGPPGILVHNTWYTTVENRPDLERSSVQAFYCITNTHKGPRGAQRHRHQAALVVLHIEDALMDRDVVLVLLAVAGAVLVRADGRVLVAGGTSVER